MSSTSTTLQLTEEEAMESSVTRKLKRKPLSDRTNTNPNSTKQPPLSPPKPESNSKPKPLESLSTPKPKSNPNSKSIDNTSASIGSNVPSSTSSTPNFLDAHCEKTPVADTCDKKESVAKGKGKEKSVAIGPSSCPPAGRTKSFGNELETQQCETDTWDEEHSGVDPSKTYTIPHQKKKDPTPKSKSNPNPYAKPKSKSIDDPTSSPPNFPSLSSSKPKSKLKSKYNDNTSTSASAGPNVQSPTSLPPNSLDEALISNGYAQEQAVAKAKGKEKLVADVPFSCPPAVRTKSIGNELGTQHFETNKWSKDGVNHSYTNTIHHQKSKKNPHETYTIPRQKSKKIPRLSLPKDFVIEQNKYFAEIDAFELDEEVVDEDDLE